MTLNLLGVDGANEPPFNKIEKILYMEILPEGTT